MSISFNHLPQGSTIGSGAYVFRHYGSEIILPVKGDLIRMNLDGTNRQYRVLKINGSQAEVLAMFEANTSIKFDSVSPYSREYKGQNIDTYLNTTWYNTLSSTAKSAIVAKNITQDAWQWGQTGSIYYSGTYGTSVPGTSNYTISKKSLTFAVGNRYIYALSIQDVIDYLSSSDVLVDKTAMLRNVNIWKMFFNVTTQPTVKTYPWLQSAESSSSSRAWYIDSSDGSIYMEYVYNNSAARPAFKINLSKIAWQKV